MSLSFVTFRKQISCVDDNVAADKNILVGANGNDKLRLCVCAFHDHIPCLIKNMLNFIIIIQSNACIVKNFVKKHRFFNTF